MKLFIVESPGKCSTIQKYIGSEYNVKASVGHIREIPRKGLNIDVKNGFEPVFKVASDKKNVVDELKSIASKSNEIIIATDPDREGESIAWHIYDVLPKKDQSKCTRITFNEVKKKPILDALKKKRDIDQDLVQSSKARQVLDRLIGYKVSPILWGTVGSGTSAGRVQSVALKMICDRQKEIDNFKPTSFWYIDADLKCKNGNFVARVVTEDKDNRFLNEDVVKKEYDKIKKSSFSVKSIDKKEKYNNPYPPFDTNELQATCSTLFGWNVTKSQSMAQSLYEKGKITYIRTDSFNISDEAVNEVRGLIKKASSSDYLPKAPNVYKKKSKSAAQEAHECIRPTDVYNKGNDIVDSNEKKMYCLIRDRFIACQMSPMIVNTVTYTIETNSGHTLVAKGQSIKFDGWSKVYKYIKTKDVMLPNVQKGEKLDLKELKKIKNKTQPPPRYNDARLLKTMEKEGVGRPSTRANLIGMLLKKGYIENKKSEKGFYATSLGMKISEYLSPRFKDFFMDIKYTATLEDDLNEIADGKKTYLDIVTSVYKNLEEHIKTLGEKEGVKTFDSGNNLDTGVKCTVCKSHNIYKKNGKNGEFYACSGYPNCKQIFEKKEDGSYIKKNKSSNGNKTGEKCIKCKSGNILEKKGKYGLFYACDNYPKCKAIYRTSAESDSGFVLK